MLDGRKPPKYVLTLPAMSFLLFSMCQISKHAFYARKQKRAASTRGGVRMGQ